MHVGLADRKWVHVVSFEITEAMVDEAVCGFVRAHSIKHVLDGRVLLKTPVVFGDGRCIFMLPRFPKVRVSLLGCGMRKCESQHTTREDVLSRAPR